MHYTAGPRALESEASSRACDRLVRRAPIGAPPSARALAQAMQQRTGMRARRLVIALGLVLAGSSHARGQHAGHGRPHGEAERGEGALGLPMTRVGSGTAWLPDEAPMRAFHLRRAGWRFMLHGNVFAGYDYQAGDAGDDKLVSQNWGMAMAGRGLAGGWFAARAMLSLEPLTVGKRGYPLLLQSGEQVDGVPLVDRQHPHDLIMEAAVLYERELTDRVALQLYAALAGEPALGPVAYPHRPSAMSDPFAPLGHHWQDATHISFGVLTAGVFTRTAKLEASWFNGREPDDERYDLDLRGFDAGSVRLTINPSARWSVQASGAYLDSPEELEPDVSVIRTTASASHARRAGRGSWTSTIVWGRNTPSSGPATDAVLAESALEVDRLGATFARAEYARKSGHDLALEPALEDATFWIATLSIGHTRPVLRAGGLDVALGLRGSAGVIDEGLERRYGTRFPLGVMVYAQVQPRVMQH